jgi:hypothetical protein
VHWFNTERTHESVDDLTPLHAEQAHCAARNRLAVTEDECRDVLFATTDGALWQLLVAERGWSDERYANWLADVWVGLFVT